MSDKILREKLIRLAHEKPELREHVLPLLKEAKIAHTDLKYRWEGLGSRTARLMLHLTLSPNSQLVKVEDLIKGLQAFEKQCLKSFSGFEKAVKKNGLGSLDFKGSPQFQFGKPTHASCTAYFNIPDPSVVSDVERLLELMGARPIK